MQSRLRAGLAPFTVTDNSESRYELYDGETLAGTAPYRLHGDTIISSPHGFLEARTTRGNARTSFRGARPPYASTTDPGSGMHCAA